MVQIIPPDLDSFLHCLFIHDQRLIDIQKVMTLSYPCPTQKSSYKGVLRN
jgi:hypothetical protein